MKLMNRLYKTFSIKKKRQKTNGALALLFLFIFPLLLTEVTAILKAISALTNLTLKEHTHYQLLVVQGLSINFRLLENNTFRLNWPFRKTAL